MSTPGEPLTARPEATDSVAPALPHQHRTVVTLISFGFKYGRPPANHFLDVSFLTNPARDPRWDLWSRPDDEMRAFVLEQPAAKAFLAAAVPLIGVLAQADGDTRVALGCSGGRHRSTIVAEELARRLRDAHRSTGMEVRLRHREEEYA